jgi:hypothetical protein
MTQALALIDIIDSIQARTFPADLPPVNFVSILVGGQPSRIYTTKLRVRDGSNQIIFEGTGPDIPFTTQIKRANVGLGVNNVGAPPGLIRGPGRYTFELIVEEEPVSSATLDIGQAPGEVQK